MAAGRDPGPLAGVPVALKDLFVTRDLETTAASKILRGFVPPYESTAGLRLAVAAAADFFARGLTERFWDMH